jgi:hypothetical protein
MKVNEPMNTLLISYDLNSPGQGYSDLIEAIKNAGSLWWHYLDSTWIIKTNQSVVTVRDLLIRHIDKNDELLVVQLNGVGAWSGFDQKASDWLTKNL